MILLAALLAAQAEPGLVATYRSGDASVTRVEARAALNVGLESPHPRIPPGPFEVTWIGSIQFMDPEATVFDGHAGGEVTVTVDGVVVLKGSGDLAPGAPIERKTGRYPFRVDFKSKPGVPARLQLFWASSAFTREPIPPFRLAHAAAEMPATASLEQRGRELVGSLGCARCHSGAFPGVEARPGKVLESRYSAPWLAAWLAKPADSRHPRMFSEDRAVERRLAAWALQAPTPAVVPSEEGDFRMGRRHFLSLGCVACHFIPEEEREDQPVLGRTSLQGRDPNRSGRVLVASLLGPHGPEGINLRLDQKTAIDLAAYVRQFNGTISKDEIAPDDRDPSPLLQRCAPCHGGPAGNAPLRAGGECKTARYELSDLDRKAVSAYQAVAAQDRHPSPPDARRRQLVRMGCAQCHLLDGRRTPPLEEASSVLGGAFLQTIPFLRTPRLNDLHAKFRPTHVVAALKNGVAGDRHNRYTFRMPSFGEKAEEIARALAEMEGAPWPPVEEPAEKAPDPALVELGPRLGGFEGYSCISCHLWKKELMSEADPGAIGPDLAGVAGRLRREWFDRWLEDPARVHPGTPMPQMFKKGQRATLQAIFEGDATRQREALWAWLSMGKEAPSPRPLPPIAVDAPSHGPPIAALIPIRLPGGAVVESLSILWPSNDLLVFDVASRTPRALYTGARILRNVKGRIRTYTASGTERPLPAATSLPGDYAGYELLPDGVRIRTSGGAVRWTLAGRSLKRDDAVEVALPAAAAPPPLERMTLLDSAREEGSLARPGYRAIAYPRPKTPSGDDLIMPGAIAADPRDGRVFVASMKRGEILEVKDPNGDGVGASYEDWARGLFQEAYSMHAESGALVVLHRRNLTRISDADGDGKADRFDRVLALPHSVTDAYDYGYGLVKEKDGAWLFSYAPYASRKLAGSGGLIRQRPGQAPEEVAYGFRNPLGWCANAEGDVFYTDNQGEWVATNKLCHIVPGRFYGFPNSEQKEHASRPRGKTAVWVPYAWARSINGVACDTTGGKFGPFDGQLFMAELMYGGAIIRAQVERVNGEVQGACWPFWGKGLLGPVVLTFDPRGRMWVGSITEPGWMSQPDRGAVYRIDFTGEVPFEMRSLHLRPRGFRVVFTRPIDRATARDPASWSLEHYRYEYTGSYGSPELDRAKVEVESVEVASDGLSAELRTPPIQKDRVYLVGGRGVRSARSEPLENPVGAYTVNEVPVE